ncbi:MAG: DUF624 domain-containing protein [Anaerolineae bacterium]|nr:DUF624 domain-containing protein [Anaerolineae bacterium]
MIAGLRAVWRGLKHFNQAGHLYIWCNIAWILLTLPVLTAPAAWAGMIRLSWTIQRQPTASWSDFWQGFRENLRRGVVIALANVAYFAVLAINWTSYAPAQGFIFDVLRGMWLLMTVLVIVVQLYIGPLYYAMDHPTLRGALRNALVMVLLNPLFTLALLVCVAIIAVLSTMLPVIWMLVTGGALAAVMTTAVIDRLRAAGILPPEDPASYVVDPSFDDVLG